MDDEDYSWSRRIGLFREVTGVDNQMRTFDALCYKCQRSRPALEIKAHDKASGKDWLITSCTKCKANLDIQEVEKNVPPAGTTPNVAKKKHVPVSDYREAWRKYYGF